MMRRYNSRISIDYNYYGLAVVAVVDVGEAVTSDVPHDDDST
jgi:hypothetical protein